MEKLFAGYVNARLDSCLMMLENDAGKIDIFCKSL